MTALHHCRVRSCARGGWDGREVSCFHWCFCAAVLCELLRVCGEHVRLLEAREWVVRGGPVAHVARAGRTQPDSARGGVLSSRGHLQREDGVEFDVTM